jgi:hypothetical protein
MYRSKYKYNKHLKQLLRKTVLLITLINKQTPWPESVSELYRPSDSRLTAKLVPTFVDREVSRGQGCVSPTAVSSVF